MVLYPNGYLTVEEAGSVPEYDESGNIVTSAPVIGEVVQCQIDGTRGLSVVREGTTVSVSATVYVNKDDAPSDFAPKKVRLYHYKKGFLGVFGVLNVEWYEITQAWVLTV